MPGMLYYPFVNPSPSVINQAVLYWDFLSTITPSLPEIYLNDSMTELLSRGFYRPIQGSEVFPTYDDDMYFFLLKQLALALPLDEIIPATEDPALETRRMYAEKLGESLAEELVARGLASISEVKGELAVTPRLQTALMSIAVRHFAGEINDTYGRLQDTALSPFTDEPSAFINAHRTVRTLIASPQVSVEIGGLLPSPRESVMLDDLFAFRERYDDERRRLMLALELLLSGLGEHYGHAQDVFKAMQNEIESALNDMRAAAKSRKVALVTKSLATLVAVSSAGIATHLPEAAWILGVIGGVAINVSTQEVRDSGHRHLPKYSYLYRVDRMINC